MAARKTDENVVHLTVEVLKDIRKELVLLRQDTGRQFASLEGRFASLERTTAAGFAKLDARIDHLVDLAGDGYRDHERRLRAVETKLARLGMRHGR